MMGCQIGRVDGAGKATGNRDMQNVAPFFEEGTEEIFVFAHADLGCFHIASGALGSQKGFGTETFAKIVKLVFAVKNDVEIYNLYVERCQVLFGIVDRGAAANHIIIQGRPSVSFLRG